MVEKIPRDRIKLEEDYEDYFIKSVDHSSEVDKLLNIIISAILMAICALVMIFN